jgi:hypothetical protein
LSTREVASPEEKAGQDKENNSWGIFLDFEIGPCPFHDLATTQRTRSTIGIEKGKPVNTDQLPMILPPPRELFSLTLLPSPTVRPQLMKKIHYLRTSKRREDWTHETVQIPLNHITGVAKYRFCSA